MTDNSKTVQLLNALGNEDVARQYSLGLLNDKDIRCLYSFAKTRPGSLDLYGRKPSDFHMEIMTCGRNQSVIKYFKNVITEWHTKTKLSSEQNVLNLERLKALEVNACGIGLRKVIKVMKNLSRRYHHNLNLRITYLFMCIEYANLSAKRYAGDLRDTIYNRKEYLLEKLAPLLKKAGYKCGLNYHPGKNSASVFYCYLPNGQQISWHTSWRMNDIFPEIQVEWDGQRASTMLKLVNYVEAQQYIR